METFRKEVDLPGKNNPLDPIIKHEINSDCILMCFILGYHVFHFELGLRVVVCDVDWSLLGQNHFVSSGIAEYFVIVREPDLANHIETQKRQQTGQRLRRFKQNDTYPCFGGQCGRSSIHS